MDLVAGLVAVVAAGSPWSPGWTWSPGWRVTRTRVRAPSQASRRQASGGSEPSPPSSPRPPRAGRAGCPGPRRPAAGAAPHQPGAAGLPPEPVGPARPGHQRAAAPHCEGRRRWGGGPGRQGGQQVWPASGSSRPCRATMSSQVVAVHNPAAGGVVGRWVSAASGSRLWRRWSTSRRSRGGSSRRAAATRVGSASATVWLGRSRVPWARAEAWATESSPLVRAAAVLARGPRSNARAVRATALAAAWLRRSQLAVEAARAPRGRPRPPRRHRPRPAHLSQ
jgi:hypothetical protein